METKNKTESNEKLPKRELIVAAAIFFGAFLLIQIVAAYFGLFFDQSLNNLNTTTITKFVIEDIIGTTIYIILYISFPKFFHGKNAKQ